MAPSALKFLYFLPLLLRASAQSVNQTILPTDPSVSLTGNWSADPDFGHNCSEYGQVNSTAIFKFEGTAWYLGGVVYGNGPFDLTLTLDGNLINATTPPGPIESCDYIRLFQTGLSGSNHVLNVTYASSGAIFGLKALTVTQAEPSHTLEKPKVIGAAVGSAVGVTIIAVLAWLNAVHLKHLFEALVFALTGWLFFRARRLVFIPDDRLPNTQITFFLTNDPKIQDSAGQEHLIAWRVFDLAGKANSCEVLCPCKDGKTTFGFGTIKDERAVIISESYSSAPANLKENDEWEAATGGEDTVYVVNKSEKPQGLTIGTWKAEDEIFIPFQVKRDVQPGETFKWEGQGLYLHVFNTNGYEQGCYAADLVSKFKENRLTDLEGIKIADLKPLSKWILESDGGRLRYRIEGSKRWNCFA